MDPTKKSAADPGDPPRTAAAAVQMGWAMTTLSRGYRATPSSHDVDVRCGAALPKSGPEGRCQLFAGHDGPHAVMFAQCGKRIVRTWRTANPAAAADLETNALQRPWMYGYPVPAWFETEAEPAG